MTSSRLFASLLSTAILSATPLGLRAQTGDLPSAPAAPAPAKSIFQVPRGTPVPVAQSTGTPPSAPDPEMECYAPAEGIYGKQKALPPAQKEAVSRYMFVAIHEMEMEWDRHMPRAANDPWVKGKTVAVRFAIMPDGTIDTPVVTMSSGRRSYDNHALDAVSGSAPFAPLPEGVKQPVPVCMKFGYNTDPSATKPAMPDL